VDSTVYHFSSITQRSSQPLPGQYFRRRRGVGFKQGFLPPQVPHPAGRGLSAGVVQSWCSPARRKPATISRGGFFSRLFIKDLTDLNLTGVFNGGRGIDFGQRYESFYGPHPVRPHFKDVIEQNSRQPRQAKLRNFVGFRICTEGSRTISCFVPAPSKGRAAPTLLVRYFRGDAFCSSMKIHFKNSSTESASIAASEVRV
jgi:hypothetical protein